MKGFNSILLLLVVSLTAQAADENARLAGLMRGLSGDIKIVSAPTKAPSASDVTSEAIVDAIMRTRSATFFLQTFDQGKGQGVDGKLLDGEFTPISLKGLEGEELSTALAKVSNLLQAIADKLSAVSDAYEVELAKSTSERDFSKAKTLLAEVSALIKEGHTIFNPH